MFEIEPWEVADLEASLVTPRRPSRMRTTARKVLAALHARGFSAPTIVMRPASVRFEWDIDSAGRYGGSVDRAGVVRVWVWVPSVTFGESDYIWRLKGTAVEHVVHELALRAGVERPGPQ
jgi:hypothetical protein